MNNKKTTSLLISLFVSLVFLGLIVFILSETGFLVDLNQKWLHLAALWLVPVGALLAPTKAGSVITHLFSSKKGKKFLLLTGANIILTLFFVVIYAISQYGSPLIYENHPQSFKAVKEMPLVEGTTITQEFRADSDSLGTIGLRLTVREAILGLSEEEEIVEIKLEKAEEEIIEEEQPIGQDDLAEDKEDLEETTYYEPAEIIFRLKEKGTEEWFYKNSYYFDEASPSHPYPFGFPVIEDSENKTYLVEIEGNQEIVPEENSLYLFTSVDKNNQPYLYSRYVYTRQNLKIDWRLILNNTLAKINLNFKDEIFVFPLIFMFIFLEANALFLVQKSPKSFLKIVEEEFSIFLIIYLSLAIIIQLGKLANQYTNWSLPDLGPLSAVNNLFLAIVVVLGGIMALADRKS